MHREITLKMSYVGKSLAIFAMVAFPIEWASAQARADNNFDLSSYRGTDADARGARGFCWEKVGVPKESRARNSEEYVALKSCIDKVHSSFVPAKSGPAAQSPRGNCIRDLPGSRYNRETKRFTNRDVELVSSKCGAA
jgi:hypothetical protein